MTLRDGEPLLTRNRELPFSFFPVGKGARRYEIFDVEFASSPWGVMRHAARETLAGVDLDETLAYIEQGEAFFATAQGRTAAHPLLHYYAMLNVGKAVLKVRGFGKPLHKTRHGLIDLSAGAADPHTTKLEVEGSDPHSPRVFRELIKILGYSPPPGGTRYVAAELMAQVVIGHRLWREATRESERFIVLEETQFIHHKASKEIWLRFRVDWPTMQRHQMQQNTLLVRSGLNPHFSLEREELPGKPTQLWLEQSIPVKYAHRATESVMDLVKLVRPMLWRIVAAVPGSAYRRYYLYLAPTLPLPPPSQRVSQLEAVWGLMYYLGSIVRYRPHRFAEISSGPFGAFVEEFVSVQAEQMLYLLASEMCQREIARPAIV